MGYFTMVGEPITFSGYADDYDKAIVAVEFSMDGGETWTRYGTPESRPGRWTRWHFSYTPKQEGAYQLCVRSVNEDGVRSPVSAIVNFVASPSRCSVEA